MVRTVSGMISSGTTAPEKITSGRPGPLDLFQALILVALNTRVPPAGRGLGVVQKHRAPCDLPGWDSLCCAILFLIPCDACYQSALIPPAVTNTSWTEGATDIILALAIDGKVPMERRDPDA
jgi:hypothetical protein